MTETMDLLTELRAARPVLQTPAEAGELWERIVASPADERLALPDRRLRAAVDGGCPPHTTTARKRRLRSRRVRIGGVTVTPVALLAVFAAAAAAAGTIVATQLAATKLFQANTQGNRNGIQTVLPATVQQLDTVAVQDYGQVALWGATTSQGGFCFGLRLPDGNFADDPSSNDPPVAGAAPGCVRTTQQQVIKQPDPAHAPTPVPFEEWYDTVISSTGKSWDIYFGYVEAQRTATTVRDPQTGVSAPVNSAGYFILTEPNQTAGSPCNGCDWGQLQVLDDAGHSLQPDYTYGKLLPGYQPGPTSGQP
jgi:hypothetical protein